MVVQLRLVTIGFLFLIADLLPEFADLRGDPPRAIGAGFGLAVFGACYSRVVWKSIPWARAVQAPVALLGTVVVGFGLFVVLPVQWLYCLPFYLITCVVLSQPPYRGLAAAAVVIAAAALTGLLAGIKDRWLIQLIVQSLVFAVILVAASGCGWLGTCMTGWGRT
jgi:two-component system, NarL family, sensor histidine kinase DesK